MKKISFLLINLKVLYFYLQTEFIQNLFTHYTTGEDRTLPEEELLGEYNSGKYYFLDNLSIRFGKYISKNLV